MLQPFIRVLHFEVEQSGCRTAENKHGSGRTGQACQVAAGVHDILLFLSARSSHVSINTITVFHSLNRLKIPCGDFGDSCFLYKAAVPVQAVCEIHGSRAIGEEERGLCLCRCIFRHLCRQFLQR